MSELLSSLNIDISNVLREPPEETFWNEFQHAFAYEGKQQVKALAQVIGKGDAIDTPPEPAKADSTVGQHAQMFGRAAADIIPIIVTGIAVRAGLGKVLPHSAEPNLLMQRSIVGLNAVESGTTGLLTGSFLKPTDAENSATFSSFIGDRVKSGIGSALSFTAFTGLNAGASRLAEAQSVIPLRAVLANPIGNGLITGAPAGYINAQLDSLLHDGQFTTDGAIIGKAMYEMAMIGGAFGALQYAANYRNQLNSKIETSTPAAVNMEANPVAVPGTMPHTESGTGHIIADKSMLGTELGTLLPEHEHPYVAYMSERIKKATAEKENAQRTSPVVKLFGGEETLRVPGEPVSEPVRDEPDSPEGLQGIPGYHVVDIEQWVGKAAPSAAEKQKAAAELEPVASALKESLGADSPELKRLVQVSEPAKLIALKDFIDEAPERRRIAVLEELAANRRPVPSWLKTFEQLEDLGVDKAAIARIKNYPDSEDAGNTATFVLANPEKRVPHVETLARNNAHFLEFNPDMLKAMETLEKHLGADSLAMTKIAEYKTEWLARVAEEEQTVQKGKAAFQAKMQKMAGLRRDDDGSSRLDFFGWDPHFGATTYPTKLFDKGNSYNDLERFTDIQKGKKGEPLLNIDRLESMADFLSTHSDQKSVLERQIQQGVLPDRFDVSRLRAIADIEKVFGENSALTQKIMALEAPKYALENLQPMLQRNPELVERLVNSSAKPSELTGPRLRALSTIESTFGTDSPTTARLLEMEREGVDLLGISQFLERFESKRDKDSRTKNAGETASEKTLEGQRDLVLKEILSEIETHNKPLANIELTRADRFLNLRNLMQGRHESPESSPVDRIEHAGAFIEKLISEKAPLKSFSVGELNSRFDVEQSLGADSPLFQKIVKVAQDKSVGFGQFSSLINHNPPWIDYSDTKIRPEFLSALLDVTNEPIQLDSMRVKGLQQFNDLYDSSTFDLAKLVKLQDAGVDLKRLSDFIEGREPRDDLMNWGHTHRPVSREATEKPISAGSLARAAQVRQLIDMDAPAEHLNPSYLRALNHLNEVFGADSPVMQHLAKVATNNNLIAYLGKLIKKDDTALIETVRRLTEENAPAAKLDSMRVNALSHLEQMFPRDSHYMRRILEAEEKGAALADIDGFLAQYAKSREPQFGSLYLRPPKEDPVMAAKAMDLTKRLLDEDLDPQKLLRKNLTARLKLETYLGQDSPAMKRILEFAENGFDITKLKEFIDEDHHGHAVMVKSLIESGATAQELSYSRLRGLSIIINQLKVERPAYEHLLSLEKQGLKISELANYIQEYPGTRVPQVKTLLENNCLIQDINVKRLADAAMLEKLKDHFADDQTTLDSLYNLQKQNLSANRLVRFIDEDPEFRTELVKKLVRDGAGVARFNNQMTLSVFPDDVAYNLLETTKRDGTYIGPLLGHLRDWKSGSAFRDAIIDRVRAGHGGLGIEELKSVFDQVKLQQQEAEHAAKAIKSTETDSQTKLSDDDDSPYEFEYDLDDGQRGEQVANILKDAVKAIDKTIPLDTPIVLLGRDSWPLLPALREQGRMVQYFLWSRLQDNDALTNKQWLREVPPNAAVIDTGYSGSILDNIRTIDPSATGYLLSSSGKYPQLLDSTDHSEMVQAMEYFPKLVSRSKTYTEKGGAVARAGNRDEDEEISSRDLNHRWFVQGANVDMLRHLGLSPWSVWRFSEYVGLTPKERILVDSNSALGLHYKKVEDARREASQGVAN